MDVLSKKDLNNEEEKLIRQMLAQCFKLSHFQEISELTIKLRRKYAVKLPDAIIAATAQFMEIPLLPADKGFAYITEIDCIILSI